MDRQIEPALFGVIIQPNSIHCGRSLSAISLPEHCALLGLLRGRKILASAENPSIYVGDILLAIAIHPMFVPALKVVLKQTHPVYYSPINCSLAMYDRELCYKRF